VINSVVHPKLVPMNAKTNAAIAVAARQNAHGRERTNAHS
jgi:hypothetical protein